MRKSRVTETQIVGITNEQEPRLAVAEVCRKHSISPGSFYKLKAKFGEMDVSDARPLKQLEEENANLKRLVRTLAVNDDCTRGNLGLIADTSVSGARVVRKLTAIIADVVARMPALNVSQLPELLPRNLRDASEKTA
jgi:putative transposase